MKSSQFKELTRRRSREASPRLESYVKPSFLPVKTTTILKAHKYPLRRSQFVFTNKSPDRSQDSGVQVFLTKWTLQAILGHDQQQRPDTYIFLEIRKLKHPHLPLATYLNIYNTRDIDDGEGGGLVNQSGLVMSLNTVIMSHQIIAFSNSVGLILAYLRILNKDSGTVTDADGGISKGISFLYCYGLVLSNFPQWFLENLYEQLRQTLVLGGREQEHNQEKRFSAKVQICDFVSGQISRPGFPLT